MGRAVLRAGRFGTVPDSGLQLNVAGTFEEEERAGEWLELARKQIPPAAGMEESALHSWKDGM